MRGKVIKEIRRFAKICAKTFDTSYEDEVKYLKENWHEVKNMSIKTIKGAKKS